MGAAGCDSYPCTVAAGWLLGFVHTGGVAHACLAPAGREWATVCNCSTQLYTTQEREREAHGSMQGMRSCQCAVAPAATATASAKCKPESGHGMCHSKQQESRQRQPERKRQRKQQQRCDFLTWHCKCSLFWRALAAAPRVTCAVCWRVVCVRSLTWCWT